MLKMLNTPFNNFLNENLQNGLEKEALYGNSELCNLLNYPLSTTHHTVPCFNPLRPVLVLPAQEWSKGDHHAGDPHQGDHEPDSPRVPGVDVVRMRDSPEPG